MLAEAAGVEVSLPAQVRRTAAKWWSTTRNMVPSLSHSSISAQLRQRGVPHTMLVHLGEGLPTADIAIQPKNGSKSLAIQVEPPSLLVRVRGLVYVCTRHLVCHPRRLAADDGIARTAIGPLICLSS